ncbi:LmrA/YxaF family transcription factor [Rhodococcus aetherivorans]
MRPGARCTSISPAARTSSSWPRWTGWARSSPACSRRCWPRADRRRDRRRGVRRPRRPARAIRVRGGCAVASVAVDAATDNPVLQQSCARVYESWRVVLERVLVRDGMPDAARLAGVIVSLVEGATTVARARHDVAPLVDARAVALDLLGSAR